MECASGKTPLPEKARFCLQCGATVERWRRRGWLLIANLGVGACALGALAPSRA